MFGSNMQEVLDYLDKLNIKYEIVNHPEAFTTEEADKYVEGMEGVLTKSIFMAGKKDRKFYLFIMDDKKRLDIKKISEFLDDKLHFASEETLMKKLGLKQGYVSLFGLLNNKDHDILIYIDKEILDEKIITFNPNVNTATLFMSVDDMFKFIEDLDYNYIIMDL